MRRLSIDSVLQLVRELPRLPETHVRVMNMAMNAGTSVAEITRVINTDAALTARVLQVANTPFYGMTGRIETVARATVILGMRTVHSLALGAGIVETLNAPDPREHCGIDIWKHSLQTAVAAQELAESGGVSDSEIAFTAGLLHDMGKLILATGFPDIYRQVLEEHAATCVPLVTLEQRLFGINHATAGGMLCRSWNLPVSLRAIVENHHSDSDADTVCQAVCDGNVLARLVSPQASGEIHISRAELQNLLGRRSRTSLLRRLIVSQSNAATSPSLHRDDRQDTVSVESDDVVMKDAVSLAVLACGRTPFDSSDPGDVDLQISGNRESSGSHAVMDPSRFINDVSGETYLNVAALHRAFLFAPRAGKVSAALRPGAASLN